MKLAEFPDVAAEFHPTKNHPLTPETVGIGRQKPVFWVCPKVGPEHDYDMRVNHRIRERATCPYCSGHRVSSTNSLAVSRPDVAAEWHPTLNGALTPNDVSVSSNVVVTWQCPVNPNHVWPVTVNSRTTFDSGCRFCRILPYSKQQVLLAFELQCFVEVQVRPEKILVEGQLLDVDILVPDLRLIVEYDGAFWHRTKVEKDRTKSQALQGAGYRVIRVRETPLDPIGALDVVIEPGQIKRAAELVLEHVEMLSGRPIPGLRQYRQQPGLLNESAAIEHIQALQAEAEKKRAEKKKGARKAPPNLKRSRATSAPGARRVRQQRKRKMPANPNIEAVLAAFDAVVEGSRVEMPKGSWTSDENVFAVCERQLGKCPGPDAAWDEVTRYVSAFATAVRSKAPWTVALVGALGRRFRGNWSRLAEALLAARGAHSLAAHRASWIELKGFWTRSDEGRRRVREAVLAVHPLPPDKLTERMLGIDLSKAIRKTYRPVLGPGERALDALARDAWPGMVVRTERGKTAQRAAAAE